MITETYKGRKIRIVKGRGRDFGYSRVTLNGTELGKWQGDEIRVQGRIRGSIDAVDKIGNINGNKYGAEWYAPGTFEMCENGHPKEIGGGCLHSYCIERRPVPVTEPTAQPATSERYPVGTKVQVANGGLGSRFRNEDERVGEFAGTVIATSGPAYTGISEACVESETGERRMLMVGDLEEVLAAEPVKETRTMDKVKIWYESGAYEEVTAEHERFAELASIFVECQVNGRITAAELYEGNGDSQGFRRVATLPVRLPLATVVNGTCGRHGSYSVAMAINLAEHPSCARVPGHGGLHRNTVTFGVGGMVTWGDNECEPVDTARTVD